MVDPVALDVNHGLMFRLHKGHTLAGRDEYAVPCLSVSKDDEVFWEALTDLMLRDPWHIAWYVLWVL